MLKPEELKPEEQAIALHRESLFLLGRGGTGKSTILMWRMGDKEERRRQALAEGYEQAAHFRQLLVTANPRLCRDLQTQFRKVCNALPALPDELEVGAARSSKRLTALSEMTAPYAFITFERLLKLLDADLEIRYFSDAERQEGEDKNADVNVTERLKTAGAGATRRCVNLRIFRREYWRGLPENLTKGKEPGVVYSEIMSLIKGSKDAALKYGAPVPRAAFLDVDAEYAWQSAFPTARLRSEVYDLFEAYEKLKKKRGEYDLADAVLHALRQLREGRYHPSPLQRVYIDEVQDLSIAQLILFGFVCRKMDGFSFAGDTAQTIAGSGFRFEGERCRGEAGSPIFI
eukprot:tig00021254_g19688.t1